MSPKQIVAVADVYIEKLKGFGFAPRNTVEKPHESLQACQHILWMCQEIKSIAYKDMEKACRWLGFIQGVLWTHGTYTINQMREHNRG